ncbi:MAG: hypothetical protein ACLUR5_13365 [Eubacterium ventriosum]
MKKLIYLTTIFTILVSLTFIPAVQTNATSRLTLHIMQVTVTLNQNLTVAKIKLLSKIN